MRASQPLTEEQIAALCRDLESDRIERKESFRGKSPDTVREAVCAFSNDLAGHQEPGVIVIGVSDTGLPVPGFEHIARAFPLLNPQGYCERTDC